MRTTFASLRFYNYRLWFFGAMFSNIGTWMQRVAQDWLVLTVLTHNSGVAVGLVTGLQFLPALLLSPWAGVLADRFNQRRMLMATQAAMALLALGLGLLVVFGHVELWHVYVFAGLLGCATALDGPVRQTFVAALVPPTSLPNAVGLNSASFNTARLIGPGVAGLMIAWVGTGWVFLTNGLTFVATIGALLFMRRRELVTSKRAKRSPGQIREALHYVRGRADIVLIMVVAGVVSTFGLNFQLTTALMARTVFDKGPGEYGILGSVIAIGSLSGALLAARRKNPGVRLVVLAAFAFALATGVMTFMPTYLWYAISCIPVGLAALTMMTAANATIQITTEPAMRGRVMALYMMVFMGATPIGAPIVGWIGGTFGARWAIGIGSIASLLIALGAAAWSIRHWDLDVTYHLHRPRLRVTSPSGSPSASAERAAREEAALLIGEQEIEDSATRA
jgi:MFS family permease